MKAFPVTHPSALVAVPVLVLGLAGCAATVPAADDGVLRVVASTDAWGSVAEAVGGDRTQVTSIIHRPGQDPHEYEASARDQLAVSRADLVLENGGGYDPFIGTLVGASRAHPVLIDAVEVSGLLPVGGRVKSAGTDSGHVAGFNEHVWYDLPTAGAVAERVAKELTRIDPAGAHDYAASVAAFEQRLKGVEDSV